MFKSVRRDRENRLKRELSKPDSAYEPAHIRNIDPETGEVILDEEPKKVNDITWLLRYRGGHKGLRDIQRQMKEKGPNKLSVKQLAYIRKFRKIITDAKKKNTTRNPFLTNHALRKAHKIIKQNSKLKEHKWEET